MSTVDIHVDSVEYLYLPFTSSVTPGDLSNGQVAFTTTLELGDSPTWINATVVTDEPETGTNALRITFGTDWQPSASTYYWWAKFVDSPETPIERGDNKINVFSQMWEVLRWWWRLPRTRLRCLLFGHLGLHWSVECRRCRRRSRR